MIDITNRRILQEIRNLAELKSKEVNNILWIRAYQNLADSADRLDAMHARVTVQSLDLNKEIYNTTKH